MAYSFDGVEKLISLSLGTTSLDLKDLYSRWKDWILLSDNSKYLEAFSVVGGEPIDVGNGIYITSYYFLTNDWKIKPQEANHKLVVSNGVLLADDGSDPFIQTTGAYNVLVQYSQPVRTETVLLETGVSGLTAEESAKLDNLDVAISTRSTFTYEEAQEILNSYDPPTRTELTSDKEAIITKIDVLNNISTTDVRSEINSSLATLNDLSLTEIMEYVIEGTLKFEDILRIMFSVLAGKASGGGTTSISYRDIADLKDRLIATVDSSGNRTSVTLDGT